MSAKADGAGARACWFVGAAHHGTDDQTLRFVSEGLWQNWHQDKYVEAVRSIRVGDRIAIKSSYTRKRDLPFDNRGNMVSVMAIKAVGTVTENPGDGHTLKVAWTLVDPPREWYFHTGRTTVWRVLPGDWHTDALIGFAFEGRAQDIDRFRNAPYWRERFGDTGVDKRRFKWTSFYEAVADGLLSYRHRREELVAAIHAIASRVGGLANLQDHFTDGSVGPLKDICPFTTMGILNRGITDANRRAIATELARLLRVTEPVPESFEGIPFLNNQRSWFFSYDNRRQPGDIDVLWEIFAQAIAFAQSDDADARSAFASAYDKAAQVAGVGWNLTMGLFWIRPWEYATLDSQSQRYLTRKLNVQVSTNGPKGRCSAVDYLDLVDALKARFQEDAYPVHSFPELSLSAWLFRDVESAGAPGATDLDAQEYEPDVAPPEAPNGPPIVSYSVDDILAEGCFLSRSRLVEILERLRTKKNVILQGPPGTGKTWLARRLAFALIGQRDDNRVRALQFHPNLSYEDFVRGWRPAGDGKLALVDGPFIEMINVAIKDPVARFVVVIEEINRGNPAQILGEMLTLLEVDKRTPSEALELSYRRSDDERVFIPDNLYVIGTMNVADRSLALVDLALRRRFAFVDLQPVLGQVWRDWVQSKCGMDAEILADVERRINALNQGISTDSGLGPQFQIGHSYVTPPFSVPIGDAREWFRQVVQTEIGPLLDEYWFDAPDKARQAKEHLLEGF